MLLIVEVFTFILTAICPLIDSLTVHVVVLPLPLARGAVGVPQLPEPIRSVPAHRRHGQAVLTPNCKSS